MVRPTLGKVAPRRRDWFKETFDTSPGDSDLRSQILNYGEWFEPVWGLILNDNMGLKTAAKLGRDAKKLGSNEGILYTDALKKVLKKYNSLKYVSFSADGKKYRRSSPDGTRVKKQNNMDGFLDFDSRSTKKFRSAMKAMVTKHIESRLPSIDKSIQQELLQDFYYGLRVLLLDLGVEVNKHFKRLQEKEEFERPSWRRFQAACEVLGTVATLKNIPSREDLRKRYRERASKHHPDRNEGDERYVKQYHAVNDAWSIVKDYYRVGSDNE